MMTKSAVHARRGWPCSIASTAHHVALVLLCWFALGSGSLASAQAPRILLVSAPDVPEDVAQAAERSLATVGNVVDAHDYLGAARSQHLGPHSAEALTRLAPKTANPRMSVSLEAAGRGKLQVTFRNGHTGAVVDEEALVMRGRRAKLSRAAARQLSDAARRALSKLGARVAAAAPLSSGSDDDDDDSAPTAAAKPARAPVRQQPVAQAAPAKAAPRQEEPETEDQPAVEAPKASAAGSGDSAGFGASLSIGGGVGARMLTAPTRNGGLSIDTGFAPSLEIGAAAGVQLGSHWLLGGEAQYRTFFGLRALEVLADGSANTTGVSSHSVALGASAGYRTGERGTMEARLLVGWTFRTLSPSATTLPSSSVHGLVIRPELRIPMADGLLTLRLAPELLISLGSTTRLPDSVTGLQPVGIGFGGDVSLDVRLATWFDLGVEYRESRLSVASAWKVSMLDVERYIVGRFTFKF